MSQWHQSRLHASVSQSFVFLWFWCSRILGPRNPINTIFPWLFLARGRAPLVLAIIHSLGIHSSRESGMSSSLLFCPGTHPQGTEAKFILAKFPLLVVSSFSLCTHAAKMGFPSYLLMSCLYSQRKNHCLLCGLYSLSPAVGYLLQIAGILVCIGEMWKRCTLSPFWDLDGFLLDLW